MAGERRRDDLRCDDWDGAGEGGLLVFDPITDAGHLLNPASAAVFEACDGATSREEMARRVAERTGLPDDPAIVDLAMAELAEAGLLREPDLAGRHLSRRQLMARLAVGAGIAALLPVVETVVSSSDLAAASSGPQTALDSLVAVPKTATTTVATPVDITLSTTGGGTNPTATLFFIDADPGHGTAALNVDVVTYTPTAGFTGTDTFTYIATQCFPLVDALPGCPEGTGPFPSAGTAPATVTITVNPAPTTTTTATTTTEAPTTTAAVAPAAAAQPNFTG
jgi:hypothetical protein